MSASPLLPAIGILGAAEITAVLAGLGPDGTSPLHPPYPSFPKDPDIRARFANTMALVSARALHFNASCLALPRYRTGLILRMASWLVATNRFSMPLEAEVVDQIARATASWPDWSENCGVPALLRKRAQASARTYEPPPFREPPVLYQEGSLQLVELIHPDHLTIESEAMDHCLGRQVDEAAARRHLASRHDPRYLRYWRRIAGRVSRIFSLRVMHGASLATAEYVHKGHRISEIVFKHPDPAIVRVGLSFLVRALTRIGCPVRAVACLPAPTTPEVLTVDGTWTLFQPQLLDCVLAGHVRVPGGTAPHVLWQLAAHPGLVLHFPEGSDALMAALGPHIGCPMIRSDTATWPAAVETTAGRLSFPHVSAGDFSRLSDVRGSLNLPALVEGSFPRLHNVTCDLNIEAARCVAFPALVHLGGYVLMDRPTPEAFPRLLNASHRVLRPADATRYGPTWLD